MYINTIYTHRCINILNELKKDGFRLPSLSDVLTYGSANPSNELQHSHIYTTVRTYDIQGSPLAYQYSTSLSLVYNPETEDVEILYALVTDMEFNGYGQNVGDDYKVYLSSSVTKRGGHIPYKIKSHIKKSILGQIPEDKIEVHDNIISLICKNTELPKFKTIKERKAFLEYLNETEKEEVNG